tara:strand:+ start:1362 stop:2939 length:1578 start_codon:yes stop_codon:yes gene_type:complete
MTKQSSALRSELCYVYLVAFLMFLRSTISITSLFDKINDINSGDPNKTTSKSSFVYFTFGALSQITELCFLKYIGSFSDYIGRKPVLVVSSILYTISHAMLALSTNNNIFYAASVVLSVVSTQPVLQAWVVDLVTEESRGKALGILFGVSIGFAFMIGLPLGGPLSDQIGYDGVIWLGGIISLIAGFVTIIIPVDDTSSSIVKLKNRDSIPVESILSTSSSASSSSSSTTFVNPLHEGDSENTEKSQNNSNNDNIMTTPKTCNSIIWNWFYRNFIHNRTLPPSWTEFFWCNHFLTGFSVINEARNKLVFVMYFWAFCGQQVLNMIFFPFSNEVFLWDAGTSGIALTFIFLVIAVFNPLMLNYFYEDNLFGIGTLGTTIGYFLLSVAGTNVNIDTRIGIGMFGLTIIAFMGFYFPSVLSMISRQYPDHKQGEVLGVSGQLGQFTSLIVYPTSLTFTAIISKDSKVYWPGVVFFVSAWYFFIAAAVHIKCEGWRILTFKRRGKIIDTTTTTGNMNDDKNNVINAEKL